MLYGILVVLSSYAAEDRISFDFEVPEAPQIATASLLQRACAFATADPPIGPENLGGVQEYCATIPHLATAQDLPTIPALGDVLAAAAAAQQPLELRASNAAASVELPAGWALLADPSEGLSLLEDGQVALTEADARTLNEATTQPMPVDVQAFNTPICAHGDPISGRGSLTIGPCERASAGDIQRALARNVASDPIAAGLSDFLTQRAQKELSMWVLSRTSKRLCHEDDPLLPNTCALLRSDSLLASTSGVALLRDAVRDDAVVLPRRLAEERLAKLEDPKQADPLMVAAVVSRWLELVVDDVDPLAAIGAWAGSSSTTLSCNASPGASALYMLSSVVAALPSDPLTPEQQPYLLGAVLVNANRNATAEPAARWPGDCGINADNLPELDGSLGQIHRNAQSLRGHWLAPARFETPAQRLEDAARLFASLARATRGGIALAKGLGRTVEDKALRVLEHVERMAEALGRRDHAGLARSLLQVSLAADATCRKAPDETPADRRVVDVCVPGEALRVLSFVQGLADAQTAQDATAAIEGFVAPAGGWARKRKAPLHFGVNGYVGVGGGQIRPQDPDARDVTAAWVTGMVGPELSAAIGNSGANLGVFFSAVDLGPLIQVRFDDDNELQAQVTLAQIVAPGVHGVVGIPKAPVSVHVGASYTPGLFLDNAGTPIDGWRVGGGIAVDLVLLP